MKPFALSQTHHVVGLGEGGSHGHGVHARVLTALALEPI
jgi:hypothetical protein